MIWRSQVLLSVKKGKKRRCLNWTKVGLKVDYVSYPMSPNGCLNWTKVGLKVGIIASLTEPTPPRLNWTKVGLKDSGYFSIIAAFATFELD